MKKIIIENKKQVKKSYKKIRKLNNNITKTITSKSNNKTSDNKNIRNTLQKKTKKIILKPQTTNNIKKQQVNFNKLVIKESKNIENIFKINSLKHNSNIKYFQNLPQSNDIFVCAVLSKEFNIIKS